jgi:tRNA/rRNA methyltransferase
MNVEINLVRPAYPSNIGAAARALNTMGLKNLALVAPRGDHLAPRALTLAKHSQDILRDVQLYASFSAARRQSDLAIATSNRRRHVSKTVIESKDLNDYLTQRQGMFQRPTIFFGPESTGLTNDEIESCDVIVTIPTAQVQPSLNLAQAIMVICYEISHLHTEPPLRVKRRNSQSTSPGEYENLKQELANILERIGLDCAAPIYKELLNKIDGFNRSDLGLLHTLKKHLRTHLTNGRH